MRLCIFTRRRGQSLTELALLLPFIALLLVGLIELGFVLHAHVQVSSAAREAARAASLYRSTRYSNLYLEDNKVNTNNISECVSGIAGWSLQQTIEQAVVRYGVDGDGCPTTTGTIVYSALGRLDPTRSTATTPSLFACPTGDANGWSVGVIPSSSYSGTDWPAEPGEEATVTLCYPYRLIMLFDLLPFLGEPVWIEKSVSFQYQP